MLAGTQTRFAIAGERAAVPARARDELLASRLAGSLLLFTGPAERVSPNERDAGRGHGNQEENGGD